MTERILRPLRPVVEIPDSNVPCCFVDGWDQKYAIGCDGVIWSFFKRGARLWTGPWRPLKPLPLKSGHRHVQLHDGSRMQFLYIHHAVLLAFVGPWPDGMECRHLDGDPANNWWWNLAWGTRLENVEDKWRHGTMLECERHPSALLTAAQVEDARRRYRAGEPLNEIASACGHNYGTLSSAIRGQSWTTLAEPPVPSRRRPRISSVAMENVLTMLADNQSTRTIMAALGLSRQQVYDVKRRHKR